MSKQNPTKLKKIVIAIAGEELELTPAQAKELRDILLELYGGKAVEHHHYDHWQRWYPWTYTSNSADRILCTNVEMNATTSMATDYSSNVARLELVA